MKKKSLSRIVIVSETISNLQILRPERNKIKRRNSNRQIKKIIHLIDPNLDIK